MKVNAYPADNGKTIIVEVTGGFAPYSIASYAVVATRNYLTETWIPRLHMTPYRVGKMSEAMASHSTTYTITGIRKKDRHYKSDGNELYWLYLFTVTDSRGETASDYVNYATD